MIRRFAVALLAVAAVSFVAAPAQAGGGGGGSKRSVTVNTLNQSGQEVILFGLSQSQIDNETFPTTVSQAKKSYGGVVLADGQTKKVKVPGGRGALVACTFDDAGNLVDPAYGAAEYNLSNGASSTGSVNTGDNGEAPVTIPRFVVPAPAG